MTDNHKSLADQQESTLADYLDRRLNTSIIATVTSVDRLESHNELDLKVSIDRVFGDGAAMTGADLLNVPVCWPSGGGAYLTLPIKKGDAVWVSFSKRPIDEWVAGDGDYVTPSLITQFDQGDAVVLAGINPHGKPVKPNPNDVELKYKGSFINIKESGDVVVQSSKDVNIIAATNINITSAGAVSITSSGDLTIDAASVDITSDSLTHNGKNIGSTHIHSGVMSGPANTGTPV